MSTLGRKGSGLGLGTTCVHVRVMWASLKRLRNSVRSSAIIAGRRCALRPFGMRSSSSGASRDQPGKLPVLRRYIFDANPFLAGDPRRQPLLAHCRRETNSGVRRRRSSARTIPCLHEASGPSRFFGPCTKRRGGRCGRSGGGCSCFHDNSGTQEVVWSQRVWSMVLTALGTALTHGRSRCGADVVVAWRRARPHPSSPRGQRA